MVWNRVHLNQADTIRLLQPKSSIWVRQHKGGETDRFTVLLRDRPLAFVLDLGIALARRQDISHVLITPACGRKKEITAVFISGMTVVVLLWGVVSRFAYALVISSEPAYPASPP